MKRSIAIIAAATIMPFLMGQGCPVTANVDATSTENKVDNSTHAETNIFNQPETSPSPETTPPVSNPPVIDPPPPPAPPSANAGENQTVYGGEAVALDGSHSADPANATLSFGWTQIAGPRVMLAGGNTSKATFTSPVVDEDTVLTFQLTVAGGGKTAQDEVQITVVKDPIGDAYARFYQLIQRANADRVGDAAVGVQTLNTGAEQEMQVGNKIYRYRIDQQKRTSDLSKLVLMDNTIGKVYPGSLLWAAPVRDGRLQQLPQIPNRPMTPVAFTGTAGGRPVVFDYDGSYSDFQSKAANIFSNRVDGGTRLEFHYETSSNLNDALLKIGMSAKYWGFRMAADLENIQKQQRSVAVMTIDQVFYSASVDAPPAEGVFPSRLLARDPSLASILADSAVKGGEITYVRKVDYGRRIVVALTSEASEKDLKHGLDVGVSFIGGKVGIQVDQATRDVWNSVEGKIIIIGGSYPDGVKPIFDGNVEAFRDTVQAIMSPNTINNTAGGVPVSFELAYASDNAPMQVFETTEFAGKIPIAQWGLVTVTGPDNGHIHTDSRDARTVNGDGDVHADSWTRIKISEQDVLLSEDRRTVSFHIKWSTWQSGQDQRFRDDGTIIQSEHTWVLKSYDKPVRDDANAILPQSSYGIAEFWFGGGNQSGRIPDCGFLKNIFVTFDGPGKDIPYQALDAELSFMVWLEE